MYELNGITYANEPRGEIKVDSVKPLDDLMMLVTFSTGETRLFDATELLNKPAFSSLAESDVFMNPEIDHGVCTWEAGKIDISPAYLYKHSFAYDKTA